MRNKLLLAACAAVCVIGSASSAYAAKIPDLIGTWTCSGTTVSKVAGEGATFSVSSETVRIDAQEGYGFHGVAIVEYDNALHEEPFVGLVSTNKKWAVIIEPEGYKQWKLVGKNRAQMQDDEHGEEYLMVRRGSCTREGSK